MRKWDHIYEVKGKSSFRSFRGKVLYNRDKKYLYVVIKGLGKDEIIINGDLHTVERKLNEFIDVLEQVLQEVESILDIDGGEEDERGTP